MSGMTTDDKLVYMANQIARNFEALGHDHAVAATEDHMLSFWDPRMKARILTLAVERADALSPAASAALSRLRAGIEPGPQTDATRFAAVDEPGASDAG
jgi:formate dehydrogenase subunit delta